MYIIKYTGHDGQEAPKGKKWNDGYGFEIIISQKYNEYFLLIIFMIIVY